MSHERVSCIIPAWNARETIVRAVESILAQTLSPWEVIVIDDGSTDDTVAVAGRFDHPVRVVSQANAGAEAARNRGILESQGEFVAFLDADDLWLPEKLERQIEVLRDQPQVGAVGCHVLNIASSDDPSVLRQIKRYNGQPVPGFKGSDLLARRSAFTQVGLLDASRRHSGVVEWLERCAEAGIERFLLSEALVSRYVRAESVSVTTQGAMDTLEEYLSIAHRRIVLERARRQQTARS